MEDLDLETLWTRYLAAMNEAILSARRGRRDEMAFFIGAARTTLDTYFAMLEKHIEHTE